YELLQVFDRLSLYLCMPPLRPAELGPAPVGSSGERVTLRLTPAGGDVVRIDPWPFGAATVAATVAASVPGRWVPERAYVGDDEFRQELARAEAATLAY